MKVASLQFNPICENTYVVWDDTNECIVVDAGNSDERENARLKEFIDSRGLHPRMAVNTHGHFDHTLGVQFLKDTYGIPFALSGKDKFLLDNAAPGSSIFGVKVGAMPSIDLDLDTTDEVRFGHTALKIIPTPGHTPGHVSLYAPQAKAVFTGDTPRVDRPHRPAGRGLFVDHAFDPRTAHPAGRRNGGLPRTRRVDHDRPREPLQPLRRGGAQRAGELR